MNRGSARILYLPNEPGDFVQRGPRRALGGLLDSGLIDDARVVSLLHRVREGDGPAERTRLRQIVREFKPTIILLDKPAGTGLRSQDILAWRSVADFVFVVTDMDAYHWWSKPLPRDGKDLAPQADLVFASGSGVLRRIYRRAGAVDVRWSPSVYDPSSFGRSEITGATVTRDVVMIGNCVVSKLGPLRSMPGAIDRRRLVARLNDEFGSRFGLFGVGWKVPVGLGPLPYFEQEAAIRSAWVTANWDHFPAEPHYFSDRLPITLASGSVHFTNWSPGFDELFGDLPFLRLVRRETEMVPAIRAYLESTAPADRIEHARQARVFAAAHFRQDLKFAEMLNAAGARLDPTAVRRALNDNQKMLTEG